MRLVTYLSATFVAVLLLSMISGCGPAADKPPLAAAAPALKSAMPTQYAAQAVLAEPCCLVTEEAASVRVSLFEYPGFPYLLKLATDNPAPINCTVNSEEWDGAYGRLDVNLTASESALVTLGVEVWSLDNSGHPDTVQELVTTHVVRLQSFDGEYDFPAVGPDHLIIGGEDLEASFPIGFDLTNATPLDPAAPAVVGPRMHDVGGDPCPIELSNQTYSSGLWSADVVPNQKGWMTIRFPVTLANGEEEVLSALLLVNLHVKLVTAFPNSIPAEEPTMVTLVPAHMMFPSGTTVSVPTGYGSATIMHNHGHHLNVEFDISTFPCEVTVGVPGVGEFTTELSGETLEEKALKDKISETLNGKFKKEGDCIVVVEAPDWGVMKTELKPLLRDKQVSTTVTSAIDGQAAITVKIAARARATPPAKPAKGSTGFAGADQSQASRPDTPAPGATGAPGAFPGAHGSPGDVGTNGQKGHTGGSGEWGETGAQGENGNRRELEFPVLECSYVVIVFGDDGGEGGDGGNSGRGGFGGPGGNGGNGGKGGDGANGTSGSINPPSPGGAGGNGGSGGPPGNGAAGGDGGNGAKGAAGGMGGKGGHTVVAGGNAFVIMFDADGGKGGNGGNGGNRGEPSSEGGAPGSPGVGGAGGAGGIGDPAGANGTAGQPGAGGGASGGSGSPGIPGSAGDRGSGGNPGTSSVTSKCGKKVWEGAVGPDGTPGLPGS